MNNPGIFHHAGRRAKHWGDVVRAGSGPPGRAAEPGGGVIRLSCGEEMSRGRTRRGVRMGDRVCVDHELSAAAGEGDVMLGRTMRAGALSSLLLWTLLCSTLTLATVLLPTGAAWGQGFLMPARDDVAFRMPQPIIAPQPWPRPRPEPVVRSYKIKELAVNATLKDQIAKVQMSQTFVNTGSVQMEVVFVYPLPYDGAVDSLTFLVDGKEYEARLLEAKEARQIYESYMRRNLDPAL